MPDSLARNWRLSRIFSAFYLMAGEQGFEPWNAGIKIQCLNRLGDSPTQPVVCRAIVIASNEFRIAAF